MDDVTYFIRFADYESNCLIRLTNYNEGKYFIWKQNILFENFDCLQSVWYMETVNEFNNLSIHNS